MGRNFFHGIWIACPKWHPRPCMVISLQKSYVCIYIIQNKVRFPTAIVKICKFTVFSSGSFCQIYRVTDEVLIAETMVWPNFFLMNVFFALKGSKLFIIISYHCSWMLCRVAAVKSLPALIYSADYILLLVL